MDAIIVPLRAALTAAWIYIIYLTFRRYLRFYKHGYYNLAHILRAGLWGELGILAEIARRLGVELADAQILSQETGDSCRGYMGMFPVFVLMAIAAVDCLLLFQRSRFEKLAEEHEARLQIGRLATRLHVVSESLDQRNHDLERANLALATAESKFRDFFEHAPLHYHTLDRNGIILDSNDLELKDLGYSRDELIGQHISKLMHPDNLELDQAALKRFWETGIHAGTEVVMARKDGAAVPVRLYSTAVRDENGNITAARTIWIDIAAQKKAEAEVRRRTDELAGKNRELEAINHELSEVSHVISHDLKAPLRGIEAFLGFLEEDCSPNLDSTGQSHIRTIQDSCRRLRRMIDDLIEYARFGQAGTFETLSLNKIVRESLEGFGLNIQAKRAEIHVAPDLPTIFGDRVQITALVRNLIDNALKYSGADRPRIEIGAGSSGDPDRVSFFVRDNGIGIPKEHQKKIFGLFQRLHNSAQYEGTGIGLAMVKKAVEFHNGEIFVESNKGKGSTFYISLPSAPRKSLSIRDAAEEMEIPRPQGNRVVLG